MAGATIPLTPAVHQMISVGPIPLFEDKPGEIFYPIVRDVDTNMYERQNGSDMEVGSYAHRAILMAPDEIPSIEESALSPTELPFTEDDFELQYEQALELMPEILSVEGAGIRHAINGLLSLTPDGMPLLGETEVKGVWSVAAIWIKEAPRDRARRRGVGHRRRVRGRRPRRRRLPFLELCAHAAARRRALLRGVQQDLRDRPSDGAVGDEPAGAAEPVLHAGAGARRRLLRDRGLGAAVVVRVECAAARGVRRPRDAARGRVGVALVVADHQRGAPRDARPRRDGRPLRLLDRRRRRRRLARLPAAGRARGDGRPGRPGRLHADPQPRGRLQGRPHDHAPGRPPVPDRHRRDGRPARLEVVLRPPARRRVGRARRYHLGLVHRRRLGAARPRRDRLDHLGGHLPRGLPVRPLPLDRPRQRPHADVADLVRRRARLGDLRAVRAGPRALGHDLGGRAAARPAARPGSASTAPRAGSRRATGSTAPSSSPSTTWSRQGWRARR